VRRDKGIKTRTYLAAGVREVWLVDPIRKEIEIRAKGQSVKSRDTIEAVSRVVPGFRLTPSDLH
jgi:Uma2 family endonuclease